MGVETTDLWSIRALYEVEDRGFLVKETSIQLHKTVDIIEACNASIGEGNSPVGEGRSSIGEDNSPVGEGRSSIGEESSPVGEGRSSTGEDNSPVGEGRRQVGEGDSLVV